MCVLYDSAGQQGEVFHLFHGPSAPVSVDFLNNSYQAVIKSDFYLGNVLKFVKHLKATPRLNQVD